MTAPIEKKVASDVAKKTATKSVEKAGKGDRASHPAKKNSSGDKGFITFAAAKTKNAAFLTTDNKFAPAQKPVKSIVKYRHQIALQFWIGLLAILTNRTIDVGKKLSQGDTAGAAEGAASIALAPVAPTGTLIQAAAWTIVCAVLFGITSMGQSAAKFSATLGWLITGTLIIFQETQRQNAGVPSRFSLFTKNASNAQGAKIAANNPNKNAAGAPATGGGSLIPRAE